MPFGTVSAQDEAAAAPRGRHPRLNYRYMKTGGRAAAILVLCMGITGISAVGIGAVEELRVKLISRTEYADHAIEYYDVTGEGKIKYLTYVPEGYEMIDQDEQDNSYWAEYENCSGRVYCLYCMGNQ